MEFLGLWIITIGTLDGPWHVTSKHTSQQWGVPHRATRGTDVWMVVNILTGSTKVIGPSGRGKGVNYFDRSKDEATKRNNAFLKDVTRLPAYLGKHPEFDKTIAKYLSL